MKKEETEGLSMSYSPDAAIAYARRWAFSRNPDYYDFHGIGGDCANFVSQCLYAGCGVMNLTPVFGWYYFSLDNRTPSWSATEYLYDFLTANEGPGPFGRELPLRCAQPGDIIQLSFDGELFSHSLLVVWVGRNTALRNIRVAAHSDDSFNRPLSTYYFRLARLIHIDGARDAAGALT